MSTFSNAMSSNLHENFGAVIVLVDQGGEIRHDTRATGRAKKKLEPSHCVMQMR